MTIIDFYTICHESRIDGTLAIEDERIREALIKRDDEEVKRLIREEF